MEEHIERWQSKNPDKLSSFSFARPNSNCQLEYWILFYLWDLFNVTIKNADFVHVPGSFSGVYNVICNKSPCFLCKSMFQPGSCFSWFYAYQSFSCWTSSNCFFPWKTSSQTLKRWTSSLFYYLTMAHPIIQTPPRNAPRQKSSGERFGKKQMLTLFLHSSLCNC